MGAIEKEIAVSEFEHCGVKCKVLVGPVGQLNGYCKVPVNVHGQDFENTIQCHGGITYGMDSDRWIGFDCAHWGDGEFVGHRWVPAPTRGTAFVENECRKIAEQLISAMAHTN